MPGAGSGSASPSASRPTGTSGDAPGDTPGAAPSPESTPTRTPEPAATGPGTPSGPAGSGTGAGAATGEGTGRDDGSAATNGATGAGSTSGNAAPSVAPTGGATAGLGAGGAGLSGAGQFGNVTTQLSFGGGAAVLTLAGDAGSASGGDAGAGGSGPARSTALAVFTQASGEGLQPAGTLQVTEQGKTLQATSSNGEVRSLQTPDLGKTRFVTVDYQLPDAQRSQVQLSVGLSPEGVLVNRVSPLMRQTLDDRHIVLIGLAVAKERLKAGVSAVSSVLIQVQGR